MADYEKTLKTLEEMRSRFESGFSSSDRVTIEQLYLQICGKRVRNTGCRDCYRDAYIEIRSKLKILGKMPKKANYVLKAGAIIHPQGTSKFYSLNNCPDEVAEELLAKFPSEISKFETFPTDWESRVKARKEGTAVEPTKEELKAEIDKLNAAIETKEKEIEELKTAADNSEAEIEIETLKADLATANEKLENCKAEAQEEVKSLNKTIADLKLQLTDAGTESEKKDAELKKVAAELADAKAKDAEQSAKIEALQNELEAVKKAAESKKETEKK